MVNCVCVRWNVDAVSWCDELFVLCSLNLTLMTRKEQCWSYRQKSTACKVCSATFVHLTSVSRDSYKLQCWCCC